MAGKRYFTRSVFHFMRELQANNDREWFAENKGRYEDHVKVPALRFIEDFASPLEKISPHFTATPRSLFRIYRDTRFSKDKSPYKDHTGIQFRHVESKNVHAPGYYLHIEPGAAFLGLGIWHPESQALRAIREHIVEDPAGWRKASQGKKFTDAFKLEGDRLKRPPKGFDPEHPLIEELKRKDFIAVQPLSQAFVTGRDLPEALAEVFRGGTPFMRFLCDAVGVPF